MGVKLVNSDGEEFLLPYCSLKSVDDPTAVAAVGIDGADGEVVDGDRITRLPGKFTVAGQVDGGSPAGLDAAMRSLRRFLNNRLGRSKWIRLYRRETDTEFVCVRKETFATTWQPGLGMVMADVSIVFRASDPAWYQDLVRITHYHPTSFTRASTAYKQDGSSVASGEPRFEYGRNYPSDPNDRAIWVEEGTTNLLTANQASVETDTAGFVAQTASSILSRDTDEHWHGSASLKTIAPGTLANEGFVAQVNVSPSLIYSASVWLKGSGSVKLYLIERDAENGFIGQTATGFIILTSTWTRYSVSRLFGATGVKAALKVDTSGTSAATFYADGLQVEQKPYPTSWHLPGTSRAAESLALLSNKLSPAAGAIWAWVNVNDLAKRQVAGQSNRVFTLMRSIGAWGIILYHSPGSAIWQIATKNDAGGEMYSGSAADSLTPNGANLFGLEWDATIARLILNGVQRATISTPNLPSAFGAWNIGSEGGTAHFLDALFNDVGAMGRRLSDAEWLALYNGTIPTDAEVWKFDSNFAQLIQQPGNVEEQHPLIWIAPRSGNLVNPSISLVGASPAQVLTYTGTIAAGTALLVDSEKRTAIITDGSLDYYLYQRGLQATTGPAPTTETSVINSLTADWLFDGFPLVPGSQEILYSDDASSGHNADITFAWMPKSY